MILSNGLCVLPYILCKPKPMIGKPLPKIKVDRDIPPEYYSQLLYDPNCEENMNNITLFGFFIINQFETSKIEIFFDMTSALVEYYALKLFLFEFFNVTSKK